VVLPTVMILKPSLLNNTGISVTRWKWFLFLPQDEFIDWDHKENILAWLDNDL
jgi:hypothetical protein